MFRPTYPFRLLLLAAALAGTAPAARAQTLLTNAGDPIVGVAATAGSSSSAFSTVGGGFNQYPAGEAPPNAIDRDVGTKYLNFGGRGTGFIVNPSLQPNPPPNPQRNILNSFRFFTGNDAPERDPRTVTIEGTNTPNATTTTTASWAVLYSGQAGLNTDPGRTSAGDFVTFVAGEGFDSYRVLVTDLRGATSLVQFAEIQLVYDPAIPVPEPAAVGGVALALAAFARLRRRQLKKAA